MALTLPGNARPESDFTLGISRRATGNGEVVAGGEHMGYSNGLHQDRIVPTAVRKLPDQSEAPTLSMKDGESAMILPDSPGRGIGFTSAMDGCFDFGLGNRPGPARE